MSCNGVDQQEQDTDSPGHVDAAHCHPEQSQMSNVAAVHGPSWPVMV